MTEGGEEKARRVQPRSVALQAVACVLAAASLAYAAEKGEPGSAPARPGLTVDALSVVKLRARAVPNARTAATLGTERQGTGVVIDSKGLVLTIGYLILEAERVELSTADGSAYPATVVAYDHPTGFGLVRALRPLPVKPIPFGDSSRIEDREPVLIAGFDGVAPAYVVSRRPFVGYWEYLLEEAIFTAPATVNWSGAALIDRDGHLLGIGSLVVGDALGTGSQVPGNMFVPIDLLKPVLGDLIANGRSAAASRPWLGVNSQEFAGKVIVTRVSPEGPAERAGIRPGDVILGIGGEAVNGQADFYTKLWRSGSAGTEVALSVLQGAEVKRIVVKTMDREHYLRPATTY